MKTSTTDVAPKIGEAPSKTSEQVRRTRAEKQFQARPALKPDDLRAAFDETCAHYPKTLARLAE